MAVGEWGRHARDFLRHNPQPQPFVSSVSLRVKILCVPLVPSVSFCVEQSVSYKL